jgi:hypothetical protein
MSAPARSLLRWQAGERKTIYLCALVLGAGALVSIIYLQRAWREYTAGTPGHPPEFGDFFALWSYAKIAAEHPMAELYDPAVLHQRQVALGMPDTEQNPFPYPPIAMLLLRPLCFLPYEVSYIVWTIGTLALFISVILATCSRLPLCLIGAIVAPATTAAVAAGQSGLLAASLMTAGIRLAASRPVLSGILIGLLAYKPQIALLLPVALAAARLWRALWAACCTILAMAITATLAFGPAAWPAWLSMLPAYAETFDREASEWHIRPTVMANLQIVGVPLSTAREIQVLVAIAVATLIGRCFRRHPSGLAAAALLVGTFLATPHAFIYDLPLTTAAMALYIQARMDGDPTFGLAEILILTLTFLFPILMLTSANLGLAVSLLSLLLFFTASLFRRQ